MGDRLHVFAGSVKNALRRLVIGTTALLALCLGVSAFVVHEWATRPTTFLNPTWDQVEESVRDWDCKLPHVGRPLFLRDIESFTGNERLLRIEVQTRQEAELLLKAVPEIVASRTDGTEWPWHIIRKATPSESPLVVELEARQPYN